MKVSKILTSILVLSLLFSLCVPAFAVDVNTSGSTGEVPVELTTEAPIFSVTVPTSLPITVKADGSHVYATNAKIINNSKGMVEVTNMEIEGTNGWVIVDYDTDMAAEAVDTKVVAMKINNCETTGADAIAFDNTGYANFNVMTGVDGTDNTIPITYDAKLPTQSTIINGTSIATVIFTLAWYK